MANTTKTTKKDMFNTIIALVQEIEDLDLDFNTKEIVAFAEHEIELLGKKASSKSKKEKEKDKADEILIKIILETLTGSIGMTASEILKANSARKEFEDISNQKISALLKKLVDKEEVGKFTEKRKSYFYLMTISEEVEETTDEETVEETEETVENME